MKTDPRLLDANSYHFSFDMPSRYSDVDSQHHLNNVRLGEFYQEGRVIFFNSLIRENNLSRPQGHRVLVAHSGIDFVSEICYPEIVAVKLAIENIGRTSLKLQMALFIDDKYKGQGAESKCAGLAKIVVVNADNTGAIPIADDWREALKKYLLPSA